MLQLANFSGETPRVTPRLLAENGAQAAFNVRLDDGALTPMNWSRFVYHLSDTERYKTIFKDGNNWLAWQEVVNVVRGPVASDRLYITGDGPPKIRSGNVEYPLAVPFPGSAPVAALISGEVDTDTSTTVLYAYTWVTQFDEESEPSSLSNAIEWSPNCIIELSGFATPPAGRGITRLRIYRAQTSGSGDTGLYFLTELAATALKYQDAYGTLNEAIPSVNYNAPPDGLRGIIALPNGMMAGFLGKQLCFSEPYKPHAWPEGYRLTVDYPIVGLGAFGSTLAIMTTGNPYVASGTAPENFVMERIEVNLPCINARGIVDLGYAIAYPSHEGLVSISSAGASVVTKPLLTRKDWLQMNPYSMVAGQYSGRYMTSYNYTDRDGVAQRGMMAIDLSGEQPFIVRGVDAADGMYYDVETGQLYLLRDGQDIYGWDDISQPPGEMYWRSKQFIFAGPLAFTCILIEGFDTIDEDRKAMVEAALARRLKEIKEANAAAMAAEDIKGAIAEAALGEITFAGSLIFPVAALDNYLTATIWADGKKVAVIDQINRIVRLPSGFTARWWEVEIRGNMPITAVALAQSPEELSAP